MHNLNWDPPLSVAPEIVIGTLPVFFNCSVCEFVVPTGTLPKFAAPGVMLKVPATPVPDSGKYTRLLVALLPNTMCPPIVPVVSGENLTVIVRCAAGASVSGIVRPLTAYMVACKLSLLNTTLAVPVFVITTDMLFDVPTCTFPKFAADGLKDKVPVAARALSGVRVAKHTNTAQIGIRRGHWPRTRSTMLVFLGKNSRAGVPVCL